MPFFGSYSVTVPGAVDGWFALHEQFGKLPMHELLKPAIAHARAGFPVSPVIALQWVSDFSALATAGNLVEELDNAHHTYLVNGKPPAAGQIFKNTDLAASLEMIAKDGRDAFYKGAIARAIDAYMKRIKGDLRYEDLADHRGEWVRPGSVNYRGYDVHELPPNGQGFAVLEMLSMLKNVQLNRWDRGDSQLLHFLIEAKRLAYEDLAKFYGDPAFYDPPIEALLSDSYGRERFTIIDTEGVMPTPPAGEPAIEGKGDTTYLTVADKSGMMVSLIQSNFAGFGSGLVPDHLGFMLQNRGALFSLKDGQPERLCAGKTPVPHHHPGLRHQGRQAVYELRPDGRLDAAPGPCPGAGQHHRFRHGPPGGGRCRAVLP